MSKPIVVIYMPDSFVVGSSDRSWIYEWVGLMNGEVPTNNKWDLTHDYSDYHWFCFYKENIREPQFQVFYEKDFTEIKYQELKQMVMDSLPKTTSNE